MARVEREDGVLPDEDYFRGELVLARNLIFVATSRRTHAIDLSTHKSVWRYGMSGDLAVSDQGLLYILDRADNSAGSTLPTWLTVINLQ